jgi:hypothetical protein
LEDPANIQITDTTLDEGIGSSIIVFVPAVCRADADFGEHLLDILDLLQQLRAGEVSAVEGFRANGDGIDDGFVTGDDLGQGCLVGLERLGNIGPRERRQVSAEGRVKTGKARYGNSPDAKDDLEALLLQSRNNGRGIAAVGGSVCADDVCVSLQDIKVLFEIRLGLARSILSLDSEGESECSDGRDGDGTGRESSSNDSGETHDCVD